MCLCEVMSAMWNAKRGQQSGGNVPGKLSWPPQQLQCSRFTRISRVFGMLDFLRCLMPPNSIFPWGALFRAHSHDAPAHGEVEKPKPPNVTIQNPQGSLEHHFKDEAWLKQERQADAEWIGWLSLYQELWSVTQAVTYMVYSDDAEMSVSLQKRNHLTAKIMAESGTKEHGRHRMRKGSTGQPHSP